MFGNEFHQFLPQVRNWTKNPSPDSFVCNQAKETLNQIEPRRTCWYEVQRHPFIELQPVFDFLMFVGWVVVNDDMQFQLFRRLFLHSFQERQKLLMTVAFFALTNNFTSKYIESCQQSAGAVSFVV